MNNEIPIKNFLSDFLSKILSKQAWANLKTTHK